MLGGFAGSVYSASAVLTKDLKGAAKVDKSKISIFGDIQIFFLFFYVKFSSKISVFGQFSGGQLILIKTGGALSQVRSIYKWSEILTILDLQICKFGLSVQKLHCRVAYCPNSLLEHLLQKWGGAVDELHSLWGGTLLFQLLFFGGRLIKKFLAFL